MPSVQGGKGEQRAKQINFARCSPVASALRGELTAYFAVRIRLRVQIQVPHSRHQLGRLRRCEGRAPANWAAQAARERNSHAGILSVHCGTMKVGRLRRATQSRVGDSPGQHVCLLIKIGCDHAAGIA